MPTTAPETDFALLSRFAGGEEEAFAEIVKRYAGVVYATSYRVLQDRGRAEDVSQEVFFRLLRRPQAVSQSLGGWLHQCATRLAVDALRSEKARRRREANRRIEFDDNEQPQASTWVEISPYVDEALAMLPESSRTLLVSHFLQGKSQNALAMELHASPATVSRRMRDAVLALRAELRRRGVVVAPALLLGLCRMNASAQAGSIPATLMAELGKMAIVGGPVVAGTATGGAGFAWGSVGAWCDAAARTCGWPAEMVKQTVAAAATSAVALVAGLMIARGFVSFHHMTEPAGSSIVAEEPRERHLSAAPPQAAPVEQPPADDVRVAPAGERDAGKVVLFHWAASPDASTRVVYGDGRSGALPQSLARKLIEQQAGKTLEQLREESKKLSAP